jgi:hypothetical protein
MGKVLVEKRKGSNEVTKVAGIICSKPQATFGLRNTPANVAYTLNRPSRQVKTQTTSPVSKRCAMAFEIAAT